MRKHLLQKLIELHHPPRPPLKVTTWADITPVAKTTATRVLHTPRSPGPTTTLQHDLKKLFNIIEGQPPFKSEPGDYAELVDENDPEQGVVLRRRSGRAAVIMPIDVWDHARTGRTRSNQENHVGRPRS